MEVRVAVDATGDETIEIPMAMENFHRLGAVEFFSGPENGNKLALDIDNQSGVQQLLALVKADALVGFRVKMSARVENDGTQSLDFRLPPAPTQISLLTDAKDVVGQIPNRDDEVIEASADESGRTKFNIVSSGGTFTLQWGKQEQPVSSPMLESTSDVSVSWNSPQEQFIQDVEMTVRDSRGPISSFELLLPENATLYEKPSLISGGQFGQLETTQVSPDDPLLHLVKIPESERQKSIALSFRVELKTNAPSVNQPLVFRVPKVDGALINRGTLRITAGPDYRLRWRERPYISKVAISEAEDSAGENSHQFQYIRGEFQLPIWLDATRRELRVNSGCQIELRDNYANLTFDIRLSGNSSQSRLLSVDMAGWQIQSVENARTGARMSWYDRDQLIEIENSYTGMEEAIPILIKGRRLFEPTADESGGRPIDIPVPHVVDSGDGQDPIIISEALLELSSRGRRALVVDLERSENLQRQPIEDSEQDESLRRFAVVPPEAESRVIGDMILQRPRLIFETLNGKVQIEGNRVVSVMQWMIQSQTDLEGRLRIAIPKTMIFDEGTETGVLETPASPTTAVANLTPPSPWTVLVDGRPASLVAVSTKQGKSDNDESENVQYYDLISDALADGTMNVRFQRSWAIVRDEDESPSASASFAMPYPLVQDITLRGDIRVDLIGDQRNVLVPIDDFSEGATLQYRTLPKSPVTLRLSPRAPPASELSIGKVFVRSAVNEIAQHDQIIALVKGAGEFKVHFVNSTTPEIEVDVDGKPSAYRIVDRQIYIRLSKERHQHVVNVRLWDDRPATGLVQTVMPLAHLGPGIQEVCWQLTMPSDSHLLRANPSVGRLMRWTFDRWLVRQPLLAETALVNRMVEGDAEFVELSPMPSGNLYLFSAMDDRLFIAYTGTRTLLWIVVASLIVFVTSLLCYFPSSRHPVTLLVGILGLFGLIFVAPDAAVLLGQVAMFALIVVVIMLAIRSLVIPTPSRVLSTSQLSRTSPSRYDPSTRGGRPADFRSPSSIAVTHSIGPEDVTTAPDEVAP